MKTAPGKDERENVPSGCNPLAVLATDANCEIYLSFHWTSFYRVPREFAVADGSTQA
jgi:hypothetical protein